MAFRHTEVDGVPTLVTPTTGQHAAGLIFRVGRADETLARSGLTHLLEHLALHPLGLTDYHYNGATGAVTTSFHTSGSSDDVAAFLTTVCESLGALPMARLETERSVLRTEWSSRASSVYEEMPLVRYGAQGYGLMSYTEPGAWMVTPDELDHWRRRWFTRENAVLWVIGDIPAGLRLSLPEGRRYAVPEATSALPRTPAYFESRHNAVALDAVVGQGSAVGVYAGVLERNLYRDLRQDGGFSYSAQAASDPRGDGWTTLTAGVDALADKIDAAVGGFIDVLAHLRAGRIDEADIAAHRAKVHDAIAHPEAEAGLVPAAAFAMITGTPVRDLDRRLAELDAVTAADVHAVATEAWDAALLMVPDGRGVDWAGFAAAPTSSPNGVTGAPIASRQSDRLSLHVAPEGVTRRADGLPATVTYDKIAAMLAWPDGARRLIGEDAMAVHIEPTMWNLPAGTIAQIDAAVPRDRVIQLPARTPDQIPQPSAGGRTGGSRQAWRGWEIAVLIGSAVAGGLLACLAGLLSIVAADDDGGPDDVGWGMPISAWACTAVLFAPMVFVLVRHWRRRT